MKTKAKMFLARLLIVFSFVFIGIGVCLTLFGDEKILHPIYDVTVVASNDNETISITTTASDEGNDAVENVETSVTKPNASGAGNVSSTPVVPNNAPQDTPDTPNNVSESNQSEVALSVEDLNIALREQIQDTYGVLVKYGNETNGYKVGGMTTTSNLDATTNQTALFNLNLALSLYPKGFFQEIKDKGYPLTFYLIKRYSTDNVTGVTDSTYRNIVISIATDYDFIDTFHHEVYHYIEKYMLTSGATFTSWGTLNPAGFKYGVIDSAYSYARTYSDDAFFVNSYAMTDQYEDRASTFEYMMKDSKASCLNYGKTVWLKARTMSEQIDYFFKTVTGDVTEYWERHIY